VPFGGRLNTFEDHDMMFDIREHARAWLVGMAHPLALMLALAGLPSAASAQGLTLRQALMLARDADVGLAASEARIEAASGALRQAGTSPNPLIGVDVENFPRSDFQQPFHRTEATLYYQRQIERGGKLEARTNAARADLEVVRLRRIVRGLDLFQTVENAWNEAVAAEAAVRLAEQQLAVLQEFQGEVRRRVEAARDPLFAGARVDTQVLQAQIALDQARLVAENARRALAAYWSSIADQPLDAAEFEVTTVELPPLPAQSVDLALLDAVREAADTQVAVERSRAVPDLTLRGGVRYLEDGRDLAFVVGGSIPIGIYDTNRGNIERAEAERLAAEREIAAARLARTRDTVRLQARIVTNAAEANRIQTEVLPKADETVALVRDGFNRGAFSYLDVLDAQRALVDARARRIEALRALHADRAALNRLAARHADLITDEETGP
jgi:outer membrane protein, heavy metal efflux system